MPILLPQAQQKYVLYLTAMPGAKRISLKIFIHPQSTLKTRRAVYPITHPAPPLSSLFLSTAVRAKTLVHPQKRAPFFFFAVSQTFTCLPNSRPLALLIKPKYLTAQDCLKRLAKRFTACLRCGSSSRVREACCRNSRTAVDQPPNFTTYKITPSFFTTAPRKKGRGLFSVSLGRRIYMKINLQNCHQSVKAP